MRPRCGIRPDGSDTFRIRVTRPGDDPRVTAKKRSPHLGADRLEEEEPEVLLYSPTSATTRRLVPMPMVSGMFEPVRCRSFVMLTSRNWKFGPEKAVVL